MGQCSSSEKKSADAAMQADFERRELEKAFSNISIEEEEENEEAPMASTEVAEQLKIAVGQENAHALITSMMGDKLMDICDELVINGVPDVKKGITRKMAGVGAIAVDGYGNEVAAHLTDANTNAYWLATARAKIKALKDANNDNDKMSLADGLRMYKAIKGLIDLKTGRSDGMPIRGCCVVHYKDPETGKDLVGYLSVSGNMMARDDVGLCRAVLERAGLIAREAQTDHFDWLAEAFIVEDNIGIEKEEEQIVEDNIGTEQPSPPLALYRNLSDLALEMETEDVQTRQHHITALPVCVFNTRKVPSEADALAAYNAGQLAASKFLLEVSPGCLAAFQSTDKNDPTIVHDVQIFASVEAFFAHADMSWAASKEAIMGWVPKYDSSYHFKGHVFGGHNELVRKMTVDVGKAEVEMVPRSVGFIKQSSDGLEGPPVIVYSHRKCVEGGTDAMLEAQQAYADAVYGIPGVMAITAGVDTKDPTMVHDLQLFANIDVFMNHVDMSDPTFAAIFGDWFSPEGKYDFCYAFNGEVWCAQEHMLQVARMTSEIGGARFDVYPLEGIQGGYDFNRSASVPLERIIGPSAIRPSERNSCRLRDVSGDMGAP